MTGVVQNVAGNLATSGTVEFQLQPNANSLAYRVTGTAIIAPNSVVATINASGQLKAENGTDPLELWGNDSLQPANTFYRAKFFPDGVATQTWNLLLIQGATYDLASPQFYEPADFVPNESPPRFQQIESNIIPAYDSQYVLGTDQKYYAAAYIRQVFADEITVNGSLFDSKAYLRAPNLFQYNGVGNGIADDTASVVDAQAADNGGIFVPNGTFQTTLSYLTQLTGKFWGQGAIVTSDGNKRGSWYVNQNEPLSQTGGTPNRSFWYNGDWSRCQIPIEQVITVPPITTGSLVTNAGTAAGTTLHFASVPSWVGIGTGTGMGGGLAVTGTNIPASTTVSSVTSTTVVLSQAVSGAVANGATIAFGTGQYMQPFEMCPINVSVYAAPNTISFNQDATGGGIVTAGININQVNESGGSLLSGVNVLNNVGAAFAGYNPANPYNTAAGVLFSGKCYANAQNTYLTGIEFEIQDGGYHSTATGIVIDMDRDDAGTGAQHYWNGILFNFGTSSVPVDAWFRGNGLAHYGADFTGGDFSSNSNAAIAIKQNDRIYLKSTAGTFGATAVGDFSIYYNSVADKIIINTGAADDFQFFHNGGQPQFFIADVDGQLVIGSTTVVRARETGWTAMTGTPNKVAAYDTASVSLPELAGRVMSLQAALTTHGLIGA